MKENSMTALISAFARAYHSQTKAVKIFDDKIARLLFTDDEYRQISKSMTDGIGFFNPNFSGSDKEALTWIADNQLCPTVLSHSAFAESSLKTAVLIGARQYLILGAGYDTFAYRQPEWGKLLQIFELDRSATINDKQKRLCCAEIETPDNVHYIAADLAKDSLSYALEQNKGFEKSRLSFCSMLGLTYYLSENDFSHLLAQLSSVLSGGSSLVCKGSNGRGIDAEDITIKAGASVSGEGVLGGVNSRSDITLEKGASLAAYTDENYNALKCDGQLSMADGSALTVENRGRYHGAEIYEFAIEGAVSINAAGGSEATGLFITEQHANMYAVGSCKPEARVENGKGRITFVDDASKIPAEIPQPDGYIEETAETEEQ